MANVANQNLGIIGHNLDECEEDGSTLLLELFPDTVYSETLLKSFERVFDIKPVGDYTARRSAIIAAHRARGGLSQLYFEDLGNQMGNRQVNPYTVTLTSGSGNVPFVIATYSPGTSPQGPATLIPGMITEAPWGVSVYTIYVIVSGTPGPETQLEKKFDKLVPAWCVFSYTYIAEAPPVSSGLDTFLDQAQPSIQHASDSTVSYYGDGAAASIQGLVKWSGMDDLDSGTVIDATAMVYFENVVGAQQVYFNRITEDWDSNATWDNRTADSTWAGATGGASYDGPVVFSGTPSAPGWKSFNTMDATSITELQGFVDGIYPNYGFRIFPGYLGNNKCDFKGFDSTDASLWPKLIIELDSTTVVYQQE